MMSSFHPYAGRRKDSFDLYQKEQEQTLRRWLTDEGYEALQRMCEERCRKQMEKKITKSIVPPNMR